MLANLQFNTRPLVVHAPGPLQHKPHWQEIKEAFFSSPRLHLGTIADLTILTWNNGNQAMGILERSLCHLGVPYVVKGEGISHWINSKHKPLLTYETLNHIETKYVMGVDSRDAIVLGDPRKIVERFEQSFSCDLVFGADRMNWPNVARFKKFEDSLPGASESDYKYLNGGMWIGRTEFCREFFHAALQTECLNEAPDSEQGILKQLFPVYYPRVQLDYRCEMFQNLWLVFNQTIRLIPETEVSIS
jgi:hypothetical protein